MRTTVRIVEHDLGGGDLEAYGIFGSERAIMAVRPDLTPAVRRSRELELYGCWIRPPAGRRRLCFAAHTLDEVDPVSVRSIRRTVDPMEPVWVEDVKRACEETNDVAQIAGECGLDLHATIAIVENLRQRGELPSGPE